jgi:hypothetical protein
MGLDMYVFTVEKRFITSDVDFILEKNVTKPLHYWRKHYYLHEWMESLYVAKGGQDPDFNLSTMALNSADFEALETAIKDTDTPKTLGFFLAQSDGSWRCDDLKFIREAREALQDGLAVFYVAFW